MSKKKKVICIVLSVVVVAALAAFAVVYSNHKKDFSVEESNFLSMGSVVTAKLYGDDNFKKLDAVKTVINNLDGEISRNIETSAIAKLNKTQSASSYAAANIISKCNEISKLTDGAFDVSVGALSSLWNFDGNDLSDIPPKDGELKKALATVGYEKLKVSGNDISCEKGQQIDLGAVGKGAACDAALEYLEKSGVKGAVISVGGSILAYGSRNKAGDKWRVAVRHPRENGAYIGVINISQGFVSTSGDYEKYLELDGVRYHHILDATTGRPANSGLISVTVVCDSGVLSDALSTACFILGEEKSRELLQKYDAAAVFVDEELNVTTYGDIDFEVAK